MKLLLLIASLSAVSEAFKVQHGSIRAVQKTKMSATMKEMSATMKEMSTTTITTTTTTTTSCPSRSSRAGKYLPADQAVVDDFIEFLRERASTASAEDYIQPIKDFQSLVEQDPNLQSQFALAFATASALKAGKTPLSTPAVKNFDAFLSLLNALMVQAPAYYLKTSKPGEIDNASDEPAGMIAFPINALLAWPMATYAGYGLFANVLVNDCFLRILNYWQENFLLTEASRYVLPPDASAETGLPPNSVGWLHEGAKKQMVAVAFNFTGNDIDVTIEEVPLRQATRARRYRCRPASRRASSAITSISLLSAVFAASCATTAAHRRPLCASRERALWPCDRPSSRCSNCLTRRISSTMASPTGTSSSVGNSRSWETRMVLARVRSTASLDTSRGHTAALTTTL